MSISGCERAEILLAEYGVHIDLINARGSSTWQVVSVWVPVASAIVALPVTFRQQLSGTGLGGLPAGSLIPLLALPLLLFSWFTVWTSQKIDKGAFDRLQDLDRELRSIEPSWRGTGGIYEKVRSQRWYRTRVWNLYILFSFLVFFAVPAAVCWLSTRA